MLLHARPDGNRDARRSLHSNAATDEIILDELQIRIMAQLLMVDIPSTRIKTDNQAGDAKAVALSVDTGGTNAGGCSETLLLGVIQETLGRPHSLVFLTAL